MNGEGFPMNNDLRMQHPTEIETLSKQDDVFTGMRKWLLLDRPEGIEGWVAHSLFYLCALVVV